VFGRELDFVDYERGTFAMLRELYNLTDQGVRVPSAHHHRHYHYHHRGVVVIGAQRVGSLPPHDGLW
jgi:hypothetical protein